MEHEGEGATHCNWRAHYGHQRIGRNWRTIQTIDQNTKKSSGDLLSFRL